MHIHVHLVNQPADELVRVVMLVVVELGVARSDSCYELFVGEYTSSALGGTHGAEQVCQLVQQVVFLFIAWLPCEHMLPERPAMIQRLNSRVYVANVRVLNKNLVSFDATN